MADNSEEKEPQKEEKLPQKLWGTKIWDSTGIFYFTEVNVKQGLTHTIPTSQAEGYNSKYPFVTYNGIPSYYHGTASGNFSDNKSEKTDEETDDCYENYNFDGETGKIGKNGEVIYNVKYIDGFIKWLHNKRIKYLQYDEDLVIPVAILQDIRWDTSESVADGYECSISFDWVQQGDELSVRNEKKDES